MNDDPNEVIHAALIEVIAATQAYLPPDGITKDAFILRILDATDNSTVTAALRALGTPS